MKTCKAELSNGKPCSNKVDEGQEYCPYHLADKYTKVKKGILSVAGTIVMVALAIASKGKINVKK